MMGLTTSGAAKMDWLSLFALCTVVGIIGFIVLKRRETAHQSPGDALTLAEKIRESAEQK